jgi:hypothetical protein
MIKSIATCLACLAFTAAVHAEDLQDNVGVGLGTLIFKGNDGLISQVSAATTNGSFGSQTFAISSGTSGAKRPADLVDNRQLKDFVHGNMDVLAREMAAGKGESVDTVAELMNVPKEKRAAFAKTMQAHFPEIYSSATVTDDQVVAHMVKFAS